MSLNKKSIDDINVKGKRVLVRCGSDFVKLNELTQKKEQLESELDQLLERYVYLTELAESFEKN